MRGKGPFRKAFSSSLVPLALTFLTFVCPTVGLAEPPLNARVREVITAARLKNSSVGVCVIEVRNGRVLCAISERRLLTPASNVKLVTTGAALLLLGRKFEFTTAVYAPGQMREHGVLEGDIVVVAGGDPAISSREHDGDTTAVFDYIAAQVAKSVKLVKGNLVIDDTVFDREYVHPTWPKDELVRWYCAPVSAFALNNNCVVVAVRPGERPGAQARVILDPPPRYFKVRNRCKTIAAGKSKAWINRLPDSDTLVISGKLTPKSAGVSSPVAVADPTRYAATVLKERLAAAGVHIEGEIVLADARTDTSEMALLAEASHSLTAAVRTANKRSHNFYAEMILKTLGRRAAMPASFADGLKVVATQLDRMGIKEGSYRMDDGCGLSRRNAFSALQLACFLRYMAMSKCADVFIDSLAVSGIDGTLKGRMSEPPVVGNVLAKTGHLRGVNALSGYVKSGRGRLAFSILVNGKKLDLAAADRLQDSVCRLLVGLHR